MRRRCGDFGLRRTVAGVACEKMDADLPAAAALIADPSRAAMLDALLSGGRHSARELAVAAGIAPSTATEHLDRLQAGGLVICERVGRRREVRLAGPEVARAI